MIIKNGVYFPETIEECDFLIMPTIHYPCDKCSFDTRKNCTSKGCEEFADWEKNRWQLLKRGNHDLNRAKEIIEEYRDLRQQSREIWAKLYRASALLEENGLRKFV